MKKLILLAAFGLNIGFSAAQSEAEIASSTITEDEIKGHIYFLADDLLEGRATGTAGNNIAASYLANTLRGYGVQPNPKTEDFYQEVPLQRIKIPDMSFSIDGKPVDKVVTITMEELDYNDELVYLNYGLKEDYEGKEVEGKLLLLKGGTSEASDPMSAWRKTDEKKDLARQAGALGIVEVVKANDTIWEQIIKGVNTERIDLLTSAEANVSKPFPYLWIQEDPGEQKDYYDASNKLTAAFKIDRPEKDTIISKNVVGIIEGSDPELNDEYVIYSAHYDHVGIGPADATGDTIYNGARDNAVGTATVLSMADNLSRYPAKRSAMFLFFTAEEGGLMGSKYYVENPLIPLEQVVYVFNSDNGGYNDTTIATIFGLERTTAAAHIKKAAMTFGITAIDDPAPEEELFDRSDNVSFAAKGIPAPTFSLGFRSFDGDVLKYYHQPADEADTLDYDYLLKFFQTYVLAGRLIANDPVTPFWTAGDKYEKAGKELYNRQ